MTEDEEVTENQMRGLLLAHHGIDAAAIGTTPVKCRQDFDLLYFLHPTNDPIY